ncbi:MAG: hypothetical protein L6420_03495 [Elusimicrobia bacterium]|nr:hypothetical protein [Candidatus Omnitrophota bacterium]MCG2725317.1 hypothetical protein [Elusimicrobiota bacterium]
MKIKIPKNNQGILKDIGLFCLENNIKIYAVGGCVRDWFLGFESKDIDLLLGHDIEKVAVYIRRKYKAKIEYFKSFLTYRCFLGNQVRIDLAHFRSEKYTAIAALPEVKKSYFIKEDLKRRDFSVNSLAMDITPSHGCLTKGDLKTMAMATRGAVRQDCLWEIIDLFGGIKDIKTGKVKILHKRSFIDDPTRIFRAAKFCARFKWRPDALTLKLIKRAVKKDLPYLLSRERVKNELLRILEEKKPEAVFKLLADWSMLKYIHREFKVFNNICVFAAPEKKLALIACKMKTSGLGFLKSLELKRDLFLKLKEIILINSLKESPRNSIGEFEKSVLTTLNPRLTKYSLKPLMINGFDLKKAGLSQNSKYREILSKAARAQWKGVFKNRKEALVWLKKHCLKNI